MLEVEPCDLRELAAVLGAALAQRLQIHPALLLAGSVGWLALYS